MTDKPETRKDQFMFEPRNAVATRYPKGMPEDVTEMEDIIDIFDNFFSIMQVTDARELADQLTKSEVILKCHILRNRTLQETLSLEETPPADLKCTDDIDKAIRDLFARAIKHPTRGVRHMRRDTRYPRRKSHEVDPNIGARQCIMKN